MTEQYSYFQPCQLQKNFKQFGNISHFICFVSFHSKSQQRNATYQQYLGASLVAHLVKNSPAMQETMVQFLGQDNPPAEGIDYSLQHSCLENPHRQRSLMGYRTWNCKELDTTERLSTAQHHSILTLRFQKKSMHNSLLNTKVFLQRLSYETKLNCTFCLDESKTLFILYTHIKYER